MPHSEQLPEYLRSVIGMFFAREVDLPSSTLVTVTRVDVSEKKRHATVWLSIVPDTGKETILKKIQREYLYDLQGAVNNALTRRPTPRVHLRLDPGPLPLYPDSPPNRSSV